MGKGGKHSETTARSDWYKHNLACLPLSNDVRAVLEKGVCNISASVSGLICTDIAYTLLYVHVPIFPRVCHYVSLIALIRVCVHHICGCVHVRASGIVIWGCWLGSEKEHDKCAKLVAGCSQTVRGKTGLQRIGVEGGGGAWRPCAATVTCRAWHSGGRAAGGRGKHHPPGTVGVGAG